MVAEPGHHPGRSYTDRAGAFHLNGSAFFNDGEDDISASLEVLDDLSPAELAFLDGVTAGTALASKALVLDASKDIGDVRNLDVTNLDAGLSGTAGSVDVFPATAASGKTAFTAADNAGDTTTDIATAAQAGARTYTVPDAGASAAFVMTAGAQTIAGDKTFSGEVLSDRLTTVALTAAGGAGGATAGTLSLQANQADEATASTRAVQMLVEVYAVQYSPLDGDRNATVTFSAAGTGTLVASGNGWALIETDAVGAFACATTNAVDETVYLRARTAPAHSDATDGTLVLGAESVSATWAA